METNDENSVDAASAAQAVGALIRAAGDSQEGKEAASQIGKAAVTLTKALNNCLLPIAAVNYAFDRARSYFDNEFATDLERVTTDIPPESMIEPKASLAGPTLQGLAFSHDEPDLKELYLELLASAMDTRHASEAHPAFVEIIKQMTADEARALRDVIVYSKVPVARIKAHHRTPQAGTILLVSHLMDWRDLEKEEPLANPNVPIMVVNWIRLGLVEVNYSVWMTNDDAYSWMNSRPELAELRQKYGKGDVEVRPERGILYRTALGERFATATGIIEQSTDQQSS